MGSSASIFSRNQILNHDEIIVPRVNHANAGSPHQPQVIAPPLNHYHNGESQAEFANASSAADLIEFTAARFYECTDASGIMCLEELQGFLVVIFSHCLFNGKQLSSATIINLISALMNSLHSNRDFETKGVEWKDVHNLLAAMLDCMFMFDHIANNKPISDDALAISNSATDPV